jgi:hypothetical protein
MGRRRPPHVGALPRVATAAGDGQRKTGAPRLKSRACRWPLGLAEQLGKTLRGAASPAKPTLQVPPPLSMTITCSRCACIAASSGWHYSWSS